MMLNLCLFSLFDINYSLEEWSFMFSAKWTDCPCTPLQRLRWYVSLVVGPDLYSSNTTMAFTFLLMTYNRHKSWWCSGRCSLAAKEYGEAVIHHQAQTEYLFLETEQLCYCQAFSTVHQLRLPCWVAGRLLLTQIIRMDSCGVRTWKLPSCPHTWHRLLLSIFGRRVETQWFLIFYLF